MSGYEIFLAVIQVVILSSMFAVFKKYGKQSFLKYSAFLLLIVVFFAGALYLDKQYYLWSPKPTDKMNFTERYEYFVSQENKEFCKNKSELCKKYMLGSRLTKVREWQLGIDYLKEVFENNSSVKELGIKPYTVSNLIAKTYERLEEVKSNNGDKSNRIKYITESLKYYQQSVSLGDRAKVCDIGRLYQSVEDDKKAMFYLIMGTTRAYVECNPYLSSYFIKLKKYTKAKELLEVAHKNNRYDPLINYNLGLMEKDVLKQKMYMLIGEVQRFKKSREFLYNRNNPSYFVMSLANTSNLFVDEIIQDNKFNKEILQERFKKFFDSNFIWDSDVNVKIHNDTIFLKEIKVQDFEVIRYVELLNKMLFVDKLPSKVQETIKEIKEELFHANYYKYDVKREYTLNSIDEKHHFTWKLEYNFKDKTLQFIIKLKDK